MEKDYSWTYLKPSPEFSDIGENVSVAEKFRINWPAVIFNKACLADGAVLIQDIPSLAKLTESAKRLNEISNITLHVVDGLSLTQDMLNLINKLGVLNADPFIIYPGNGATSVRKFLALIDDKRFLINSVYLPTQRTMMRKGEFQLDVDYSSLPQGIDTETVLIIDDVVASGQTAQTIAFEIKTRFPEARCVLAAWLFLIPTKPENKKSASGIAGIDQTIASIVLKGNIVSRPPINSLSCFKRSGNKYDEMKTKFIKKYISDPKAFKEFIDRL